MNYENDKTKEKVQHDSINLSFGPTQDFAISRNNLSLLNPLILYTRS